MLDEMHIMLKITSYKKMHFLTSAWKVWKQTIVTFRDIPFAYTKTILYQIMYWAKVQFHRLHGRITFKPNKNPSKYIYSDHVLCLWGWYRFKIILLYKSDKAEHQVYLYLCHMSGFLCKHQYPMSGLILVFTPFCGHIIKRD